MQGKWGGMPSTHNASLRLRFRCFGMTTVVVKISGGYMDDMMDMWSWGVEVKEGS